ncbi:MAG: tRNA pseudouridine synthase A [Deltaproteobacteria bacterium]|nr:tRNA pseudouridine synthase A [Deltaproteobacteria bacterium]
MSDRTALLVRFGYDGARFWGLQPQPGLPTAGQAVRDRLADAAGSPAKGLCFAARTDRGVHCVANLATCYWRSVVDVEALLLSLSRERDDGLVGVQAFVVPPTVHARGISRGKHYRYRLRDRQAPDDLDDPHAWRVVPPLDTERMQAAADVFVGRHDFSSFRAGGCSAASAHKTLYRCSVEREAGGDVVVDLIGDAFLRKMVRNLVGLLGEVGCGCRPVDDVAGILAAKERVAAGVCAPPAGLTLMAVGCAWPEDGRWLLPGTPAVRESDVDED